MNIAIIGASGAIGQALMSHYLARETTEKLYAFSRKPVSHDDRRVITGGLDLENQDSIEAAANKISRQSLDLVIVATGVLHDDAGIVAHVDAFGQRFAVQPNTIHAVLGQITFGQDRAELVIRGIGFRAQL